MLEAIEKAQDLWPKATEAEIELVTKLVKKLSASEAITLLEDVRASSQYATIPFPKIKSMVNSKTKTGGMSGEHFTCWAVHMQTGKHFDCVVVANSGEGAKEQMRKYLKNVCEVDPYLYALFIGEENNLEFHRYRHSILDQKAKEGVEV